MSFNRRRYQYDAVVTQTGPTPFEPASMGWQQPESQPNNPGGWVNKAAKYAVALVVASGLFTSNYTPPVQAQQASGGSSSPTVLRFKVNKRFPSQYPNTFWSGFTPAPPVPPSVDQWGQPQSQPYPSKKVITEACEATDGSPVWPTQAIPSVDSWGQPQSQPVQTKKSITEACESSDGSPTWPTTPIIIPQKPASGGGSSPTLQKFRRNRRYAATSPYLSWSGFTPTGVSVPTWVDGVFSQPTPKASKSYLYPSTFYASQLSVDDEIDKWGQPQSQPVQLRKKVVTESVFAPITVAPVDTDWLTLPSQPYSSKRFLSTADVPYFFYNISTSPEVVTEDRWHPTWPQPYPSKPYLAVAKQQASFWSTFTPITIAANWVDVICPQPYPYRPTLRTAEQQAAFWNTSTSPESVLADKWQPIYPHRLYQKKYTVDSQYVSVVFIQAAASVGLNWEAIYPDQFPKKNLFQHPSLIQAFGADEIWWQPVLREVALPADPTPPMPAFQQAFFFSPVSTAPEVVHADAWSQPQSQPYPYRKQLGLAQQKAEFRSYTVPTAPLVQPATGGGSVPNLLRFRTNRRFAQYPAIFWSGFTPVFVPPPTSGWEQPISIPKRSRFVRAVYQFVGSTNLVIPTIDAWGQPQSQPQSLYTKRPILAAEQQAFFYNTSTSSEVVTADKWQPVYPHRVYTKLAQRTPESVFAPITVAPVDTDWLGQQNQPQVVNKSRPVSNVLTNDDAVELDWLQPVSQPVVTKHSVVSDASSFVPSVTETVTVDKWFNQTSQPYVTRRYLQQEAEFWNISTQPETVLADKWQPNCPQPYPYRKNLGTAEQQAFAWGIFTPPEIITAGSYTYDFDPQPDFTPKARKYQVALLASGMMPWQISTAKEVVTEDRWHQPASQPYPYRPYKPAAVNPYLFWNTSTLPESVDPDPWDNSISQPIYKRVYLASHQQACFWSGFTPETVLVDKWFNQTSQPIYPKRIATSEIPSFSLNPLPLANVSADQFVQPQSQPYPYRQNLKTAEQAASFWNTSTQQEAVTEDRWHPTWPQPFPAKRVVPAAYYPSFFWNTVVPEGSNVEATLAVGITQPYPYHKNLHTSNQLYQFWSGFTPLFANWLPVYPDRVEGKKYLNPSEVPYLSWNTSTKAEDVLADKWQPIYPEPYPFHQVLQTQQQLAQFWANFTPPPAPPSYINGTGFVSQTFEVTGTVTIGLQGTGNVKS